MHHERELLPRPWNGSVCRLSRSKQDLHRAPAQDAAGRLLRKVLEQILGSTLGTLRVHDHARQPGLLADAAPLIDARQFMERCVFMEVFHAVRRLSGGRTSEQA